MENQLLLLEDIDDLGRSGELVRVKPGYARNFLLPQKKAVIASKFTLRLQAKLQEERAQQAIVDRQASEQTAQKVGGMTLTIEVKVDPDGHMYGSVSALDVVRLLEKEGVQVERRNVDLVHPIKELGSHRIALKLKEGVLSEIVLRVMSEGQILEAQKEKEEEQPLES